MNCLSNITEYSSADQFFSNAAKAKASKRREMAKRLTFRMTALSCMAVGVAAVLAASHI